MDKSKAIPHALLIGDTVVHVVEHGSRPWVPVAGLCDSLGIPYDAQARRLKRHSRVAGLELRRGRLPNTVVWTVMIPLEELAWWLRTLRPSQPAAQTKLAHWRKAMPWKMIDAWVSMHGRYATARALKAHLAQMPSDMPATRRRSRFTSADVDEARRLIGEGHSQAEAARAVGMSPTTLCLILRGKYPSAIPSADE